MMGNHYSFVAYTGMMPFLVDIDLSNDAHVHLHPDLL